MKQSKKRSKVIHCDVKKESVFFDGKCERLNNRLEWVDIAKGIGIVAVLLAHAGIGICWITDYYMPMFATLSGISFCYLKKSKGYCLYSAKKVAGLYLSRSILVFLVYAPLLFLSKQENLLLFLKMELVGVLYGRKTMLFPWDQNNKVVLMNFGNDPMWFLCFLSVSWLLFYFFAKHFKYTKSKGVAVESPVQVFIFVIGFLIISYIWTKFRYLTPWSIDTASIGAIFILFGFWFESFREQILPHYNTLKRYYLPIISIILVTLMACYYILSKIVKPFWNLSVRNYNNSLHSDPFVFVGFCLYGTLVYLLICITLQRVRLISDVFQLLGRKSLDLLCFHAVVYKYFSFFQERYSYVVNPLIKVVITILVIIICSYGIRMIKGRKII